MYEINCLDSYGNTINSFTQWDVDQKITITLEGCEENYLNIPPEVHFCNIKSSEALVVRSDVFNGNTIVVTVPNILLQEVHPLLVYVYLTDWYEASSQKTIIATEIPVRKRPKPSDYDYVENIERITAEQIKRELGDAISAGEMLIKNLTFIDLLTEKQHRIYVSGGKLTLEDLSEDTVEQTEEEITESEGGVA